MKLIPISLRNEALLMLEGRGAILDVARRVSRELIDGKIEGAVIGGVAVMLHGHVRATSDVGVYVPEPLSAFANRLEDAGFDFDPARREFSRDGVPVHLVSAAHATPVPTHFTDLEKIRTVSLADLVNLKLKSGTKNILRSQDLADVINLIRANKLDGKFTARIAKPLRVEFRKLVEAVQNSPRPTPFGDPFDHLG